MEDGYVVLGAGGHAKIILDIMKLNHINICGLTDAVLTENDTCMGYPVLGTDDVLPELKEKGINKAVMGIGHVGAYQVRNKVYEFALSKGFDFPNMIHPEAVVADTVSMKQGIAVCAGAVVNPEVSIGNLCIINTLSIIEHEAHIGNGVHIAPHTTILGGACVGDNSFIGAGSIILQGVHVGRNCIIGAGSVVLKDIEDDCVVVGNPGRIIRRR